MRRLALLLVSLLVLAACGSGTGEGPAVAVFDSAASAAQDAGTARITFRSSVSGDALPDELTFTGEGAFDFASGDGRMTMDLAEVMAQSGLGGDTTDTTMELLQIGTVQYMRSPLFEQAGVNGWVRQDLSETMAQQGFDPTVLQQQQSDPRQLLEYLQGAGDVTEVGSDDVDGRATTHYRAEITVEGAAQQLPEDSRESFREQFQQLGVTAWPIDVWIDDQSLPRRFSFAMSMNGAEVGGEFTMSLRMDLAEYGVPVDVNPPPENQVTDLADLQNGLGG